ncbi:MAG: HAMP domain-containing sensor histidine kinase [Planctomycetota bacterium]|nr:HAMP domain-containing sensor histidine kinase [Planctomycetota bacterium]
MSSDGSRERGDEREGPRPRRAPLGSAAAIDPTTAAAAADCATDRLTTMAHELGNLVDGAMRYVSLAQRGIPDTTDNREQMARQLEAAHSALSRMAILINNALSPGGATLLERFAEPRPLIEAVAHAVDAARPIAEEREITIELEFSPRLVLAEAGPIYPVISNAIRNAIEAIGRRGRVEVVAELATRGDGVAEVQIDVLDDGPGPPANVGDRVFDIDFSTKRSGLGVGLALSRAILTEMGGFIALAPRQTHGVGPRRGGHLMIRYRLQQDCE